MLGDDRDPSFVFVDELCTLEQIEEEEVNSEDEEGLSRAEKSVADLVSEAEASVAKIQDLMARVKLEQISEKEAAELSTQSSDLSKMHDQLDENQANANKIRFKLGNLKLKRNHRLQEIDDAMRGISEAEAVDIAFVMDATGSMESYIEAVKDNISQIVANIRNTNEELKMRMAVVAYRDFDTTRFDTLDFVDDLPTFERWLGNVNVDGGVDTAEDLAGGIHQANRLSWSNPTRVVFIVTDAPCHGHEFHDFRYDGADDYPEGTPDIDIKAELRQLMNNAGNQESMSVYFGHITKRTDKMIARLNECSMPLTVVNFRDSACISKSIISNVRNSIFKTMTVTGSHIQGSISFCSPSMEPARVKLKPFHIVPRPPTDNEWVPITAVKVYRNAPIKSMSELQAPLKPSTVLFAFLRAASKFLTGTGKTTRQSTVLLRRATSPFAEGGCRIVYHGQLAQKESDIHEQKSAVVLKSFKHHGDGVNDRKQYLVQMEVSTIAEFLAKEYNKSAFRPKHCALIKVLLACVVEEEDDINETDGNRRYCAEEVLPDDGSSFTNYGNNTGYWNPEHLDESLLRFSEFTYRVTKSYLMVTDLQGVKKGNLFVLTDPAILCRDVMRFGRTNLGEQGMKRQLKATRSLLEENGWTE